MSLYYEGDTVLHRMNPLFKLALTLVAFIHMVIFPDFTPILIHFITSILLLVYSKPRIPRGIVLGIAAIVLGHGWINMVLYRRGNITIDLYFVKLTQEGIVLGLLLALRVATIALYSLTVAATTNPRDLAVSLTRQLGINYRYSYATYVTFRMAPIVYRDLSNILIARKIRGYKGPRSPIKRIVSIFTPLLALVVKRSITLSLSMESRGFGAYESRFFFRDVKTSRIDYIILGAYLTYLSIITIVLAYLGVLGKILYLVEE